MKDKLNHIYRRLYSAFGKQHWWPAESPFEVIVGAILTQNTNWANVEKAILSLKKEKALSAEKIFKLPAKRLAALIKSAGYYNVKAARLKNFIKFYFKNYAGCLKKISLAETSFLRKQLLSVNGIGKETADSILLYALKKPIFVVDTYTKRIMARHAIAKEGIDYQSLQDVFMQNLKKDTKFFNEYHALLVRLGKDYCRKTNPKCDSCPLNDQ